MQSANHFIGAFSEFEYKKSKGSIRLGQLACGWFAELRIYCLPGVHGPSFTFLALL